MQSAPAPGSSASAALVKAWTTRGPLAWLLWPLSWLYGLLVALRLCAYQIGIFKSHHAGAPVLVVGNVVAGGAGKTPVVMLLVAHFQARGVRVGVVSRGYGRSTLDCREVLPQSLAQDVGDEPKLVQQTTGAPVFVARKRYEAAAALLARYPHTQLVICDDGLQHLALHRDLEICVFDDRGVGNGFLLPAGPLREPWPRKVDFILHSGRPPAATGTLTSLYAAQRRLADYALRKNGERIPLASLVGKPLAAVAAIAQPENFFALLRQQGLSLEHTIALPDHYDFNSFISNKYETYTLVCTEKDAVKLWPLHPDALAVPLVLSPEPGFLNALDLAVDRLLEATAPQTSPAPSR
jgi:tetraacyldisaccharide 4'-kinase